MADYPCDQHMARYAGSSNRVYLNVYRDDHAVKFKGSVCGDCLAELVGAWLSRMLHQTPGGGWDPGSETLELEEVWIDAGSVTAPPQAYRRH